MKHLIKSCILAVSVLTASCQPVAASDLCSSQSDLAAVIMKARQSGISISKSLKIADSSSDANLGNATKALVKLAYTKPRYSSDEFRENAVVDFGTEVYNLCVQATGK